MDKLAFISYRRTDSLAATRGLAEQLRTSFGFSHVFIDNTISFGEKWPDRIEKALAKANVLLAIIGPNWLTASDQYGRRRLDLKSDWVRREIQTAIETGIPIVPVLLQGGKLPDNPEALPDPLIPLLSYKWYTLPDEEWDNRLRGLLRHLEKDHGFISNEVKVEYPNPEVDVFPLTLDELDAELRTLKSWELVESHIPGDYPSSRLELRKVFRFNSFLQAVQFMNDATDFIERPNPYVHHPRWENIWRTVTVWLSTWDINHRVSRLDILLAKELDRIERKLSSNIRESSLKISQSHTDGLEDRKNNMHMAFRASSLHSSSRLPQSARGALFGRTMADGNSGEPDADYLEILEKENADLREKLDKIQQRKLGIF